MHEAILVSLQALLDWGQGDSKWIQGRRGRRSVCGDGKRNGFFVRMGIKHQNLARQLSPSIVVNALHACRVRGVWLRGGCEADGRHAVAVLILPLPSCK